MVSAIALPSATLDADTQLDKVRVKVAAFITDKMEKLGGSRIVFALEEANSVAMLLRAGSLPGRSGLVEQQVVQPAAKP
ncbi:MULTISPECIES: hypothetical protein [Bradyrhizobium]|uniref:Uncharacterized protein n=1 Tax=Bradyrhizobium vignae TaxID=1549949 RepID=A0A2U3PZ52_9BRAD|nr:protein of unknown function [Bradyrhizobium vignae]